MAQACLKKYFKGRKEKASPLFAAFFKTCRFAPSGTLLFPLLPSESTKRLLFKRRVPCSPRQQGQLGSSSSSLSLPLHTPLLSCHPLSPSTPVLSSLLTSPLLRQPPLFHHDHSCHSSSTKCAKLIVFNVPHPGFLCHTGSECCRASSMLIRMHSQVSLWVCKAHEYE